MSTAAKGFAGAAARQDEVYMRRRRLDVRLARGAIVIVVVLQFLTINNFSFGSPRLAPGVEIVLLVLIVILDTRRQRLWTRAESIAEQRQLARCNEAYLRLRLVLTGVVSFANAYSLFRLLAALLSGQSKRTGTTLLLDALNLWSINVIVFALWYWALDRGARVVRTPNERVSSEFLFPQLTLPEATQPRWRPGFIDYLFLSFTTSTAFSPTDTLPLTWRMKLLMMLEASMSLLTLALVAARAVNILA